EMLVLRKADRPHAASDDHLHAILDHLPSGNRDRHESRAALAVDGHAGNTLGKTRAGDRQSTDVVALRALLNRAAEHQVLDLGAVDTRAPHRLADRVTG